MAVTTRIFRGQSGRIFRSTVAMCALAAAIPGSPAPAEAQNAPAEMSYKTLPIHEKLKDPRRQQQTMQTVNKVLLGSEPLSGTNKSYFDAWYTWYFFPNMTQLDPLTGTPISDLAKDRQRLLREISMARSTAAQSHLRDMAYAEMSKIVQDNYHPAARLNAMLIIGELNSQEPTLTAPPKPAEPLRDALNFMLTELDKPEQIDAVKNAALVGILRHAELDGQLPDNSRMEPNFRNSIIKRMLTIVQTKQPPEGRTMEGHIWMQRRAIDVLGALRDSGLNGDVPKELETIIANESAPLSLRFTAAVAMGRLNIPANSVEPADVVRKLGELATQATKKELARLEDELKAKEAALQVGLRGGGPGGYGGSGGMSMAPGGMGPGGMGPGGMGPGGMGPGGMGPGGMGPGGMGPRGMMPGGMQGPAINLENYQIEVARRRLKYQLYSVQLGLAGPDRKTGGLYKLAAADHKTFTQKVLDGIEKLVAVTDQPDLTAETLLKDSRTSIRELETALRTAPVSRRPAAAPAPAGDSGLPAAADLPPATGGP